MKVYIPFNMVTDIDFGLIRITEKVYNLPAFSENKIKSFLLKRENENPIPEYCELRKVKFNEYIYQVIMENYYDAALELSEMTDILSFIISTYKLGLSNEMEITIGCNTESEIKYLQRMLSGLNFKIDMDLNINLNLNNFDYIFSKVLDEFYVDYLEKNKIQGKRLYVANYKFNTLVEEQSQEIIIDPLLHLRLDAMGIVVNIISIYNKKK